MSTLSSRQIIEILRPFVTPERHKKILDVIENRTRTVIPVLENIFDHGNASAVIRSAEAMGYLDVHRIEGCKHTREANRVTQGAEKWVQLSKWTNTTEWISDIRKQGYRICVSDLSAKKTLKDISWNQKTALVFGNEKRGTSEELLSCADEAFVFPMSGFTQSFNISVAAALCLAEVRNLRTESLGKHGDLSSEEKLNLEALYFVRSVDHAQAILQNRAVHLGWAQPSAVL